VVGPSEQQGDRHALVECFPPDAEAVLNDLEIAALGVAGCESNEADPRGPASLWFVRPARPGGRLRHYLPFPFDDALPESWAFEVLSAAGFVWAVS
jgi:hypothetical protein